MELEIKNIDKLFPDDFINNNLKSCEEILAIKDDAFKEVESFKPEDFDMIKHLFNGLLNEYVNSVSILSYCLRAIKELK